jgi:hypothetical protein
VSGEVEVRSEALAVRLRHGDGAAIDRESHLKIEGCEENDDSEVLVFDLA